MYIRVCMQCLFILETQPYITDMHKMATESKLTLILTLTLIPTLTLLILLPLNSEQSWVCSNLGPPLRELPNRNPNLGLQLGGLPIMAVFYNFFSLQKWCLYISFAQFGITFGVSACTMWTWVGRRMHMHRFNRICQVVPMCPHGRTHCRHLVNMIEPSI